MNQSADNPMGTTSTTDISIAPPPAPPVASAAITVSGRAIVSVQLQGADATDQTPKLPFPEDTEIGQLTEEQWEQTKNLITISETLEKRIQFESSWIGQRMSWLVISQSFLFSAFATSATKSVVFQTHPPPAGQPVRAEVALMLPLLIAALGLVQAVAAFISIVAAKNVNAKQATLRGKIDSWIKTNCVPKSFFKHWPNLGREGRTSYRRNGNWRGVPIKA